MRKTQEYALETAKEITIAALQGCQNQVNAELGDYAAKYFEAVYNKVLELASSPDGEN